MNKIILCLTLILTQVSFASQSIRDILITDKTDLVNLLQDSAILQAVEAFNLVNGSDSKVVSVYIESLTDKLVNDEGYNERKCQSNGLIVFSNGSTTFKSNAVRFCEIVVSDKYIDLD